MHIYISFYILLVIHTQKVNALLQHLVFLGLGDFCSLAGYLGAYRTFVRKFYSCKCKIFLSVKGCNVDIFK